MASQTHPTRRLSSFLTKLSLLTAGAALCMAPIHAQQKEKESTQSGDVAAKDKAASVKLHKWSGNLNVPDPVAITVAPNGDVYVSVTTRRKVGDLDIREHLNWIPDDVGLDSVEAKREFLKRELAPGKLRQPRGSLADHNKDGSIDWKDLTVHTERIYLLRDEDGDGTADRITVFAEGFNTEVTGIAAGVFYHDGWVYATIAPDLWRLKDTDGDGVADIREVVAHGFGMHIAYAGHDMHGLRLGPDGRIYWSIGDKGVNVTSKEGKKFYYPHQGAVMRVEPDGRNFEVFAHGLRNVQETAFDKWGNLFGVDNDADMKGEKERVVYIVEGSDSGWRCGHQYMGEKSRWMRESLWQPQHDGQPLYLLPPLSLSHNGPAGFLWEPGTALNDSLRGKFFLSQFPSGDISALTLEPEGASFKVTGDSLISRGIMAIGMAWHPDGSIYFADWDGGYPLDEKGGVWRIDTPETANSKARQETHQLLRNGFSSTATDALVALLSHPDQRVRIHAQLELANRKLWDELKAVAFDTKASELTRVHAIWGLGIGLRLHDLKAAAYLPLLTDKSLQIRAQTAKILGDAPASLQGDEAAQLVPLLRDSEGPVLLQTAIALGKIQYAGAFEALIEFADKHAESPVLRHAAAMGLAGCASSDQLAGLASHASPKVRACALLGLRQQNSPQVTAYLKDQDSRIFDEAVRTIHDDGGIPAALPAIAELAGRVNEFANPMTQRRVLNAAFVLGGETNAQRLIQAALNEQLDKEIRLEAWNYLSLWTNPPRLDLVDGSARKLDGRDSSGATETVAGHVDALLALKDANLKTAGITALVNLKVPVTVEVLRTIIDDKAAPAQVRAEALNLLADQHADKPELDAILKELWESDKLPQSLQSAILQNVAAKRPKIYPDMLASLLKTKDGTSVKQLALSLVAQLPDDAKERTVPAIEEGMKSLIAGKLPESLWLDLLDAAALLAPSHPALQQQLTAFEAARPAPTVGPNGIPVMPSPRELLHGGDVKRGRDIVTNHLAANCLACHTVESGSGSNVGPSLMGIGKLKSREYLLEALLQPAATIAPGFGTVSINLKDGSSTAGTLLEENDKSVKIRTGEGKVETIAKTNITFQTPPISVMPPMLGILTKREIRDVMAYLASLQKLPKGVQAPAPEH